MEFQLNQRSLLPSGFFFCHAQFFPIIPDKKIFPELQQLIEQINNSGNRNDHVLIQVFMIEEFVIFDNCSF